jgi:hypothetical protein
MSKKLATGGAHAAMPPVGKISTEPGGFFYFFWRASIRGQK